MGPLVFLELKSAAKEVVVACLIELAARHRLPAIYGLVANNQSFFHDELHHERIARQRGRPPENRPVGLRMSEPPFNLAPLAEG
jgi:hypothetical protein